MHHDPGLALRVCLVGVWSNDSDSPAVVATALVFGIESPVSESRRRRLGGRCVGIGVCGSHCSSESIGSRERSHR